MLGLGHLGVDETHAFDDQALDVGVTGNSIESLPQFRSSIEHCELATVAELVGEDLGETFEVGL